MWSKFSNAIKSLQEDSHTDVASTSRSQYLPNANLSTSSLVSNTEVLPPIPSSPGSPSKQAKRSVFRRMSKAARRDEGDVIPTPLKLSIGLPKRVKSHLHLNGNSCVFVTVPFVLCTWLIRNIRFSGVAFPHINRPPPFSGYPP